MSSNRFVDLVMKQDLADISSSKIQPPRRFVATTTLFKPDAKLLLLVKCYNFE